MYRYFDDTVELLWRQAEAIAVGGIVGQVMIKYDLTEAVAMELLEAFGG